MLTFSFSSAAPSSLIFFNGVTSGELFSSVGNANGSDLPGDDNVDKKDDDEEDDDDEEEEEDSADDDKETDEADNKEVGVHNITAVVTLMMVSRLLDDLRARGELWPLEQEEGREPTVSGRSRQHANIQGAFC